MSVVLENVSFKYMKGSILENEALKDISLKIDKGEIVAIVGRSGSGKSTLIQHFNGLLKPLTGKVFIKGVDISTKQVREVRKSVGVVFQNPEHQLFEETVYKDIAFGLRNLNISEKEISLKINEMLTVFQLDKNILERSPFELSEGQKRKIAILGVIIMEPEILVLDEPTVGLDANGRDQIFNAILNLNKSKNISIIFVSHNIEYVAKIATRLIVMDKGEIKLDDTPQNVFEHEIFLKELGILPPRVTSFMKDLKKYLPHVNDKIYSLEKAKKEILKLRRAK